jgi:TDG/mug DNA glycosylase family protein
MILPDLLEDQLALVLCGTAPSSVSKQQAAYYAHPGNIFWKTLFEAGLTPQRMHPKEYRNLLKYRIGLTDLNKTEWGADSELSRTAFDVPTFVEKMQRYRPRMIAFTSKFAGKNFCGRKTVPYGRQIETIEGIPLFVVPSTSGLARGNFDLAHWQALARSVGAGESR